MTTYGLQATTGGVDVATGFAPTGLPGATAATRYLAATVSGPPTSGTWAVGDLIPDQQGAVWECVIAGTAPTNGQFRRLGDHSWQFRPESYGAVTGIFTTHDAVMASTSSGVLTSASGLFTSAMVGWTVLVNIGTAGANQAPLITTIASYQSATQVTLAANPAATAAGNPMIVAPDNTAAIQAAWAAAQSYANSSPFRSAEMVLADLYAMCTAPTLGSTSGPFYGYSLLPITVPDATGAGPKMNLRVTCERGPGDELNYWEQLTGQVAGSGIVVLQAAPASNGTWGIPSVFGGPTVASWSGGSLTGGFANIRLHVDNLKIVVPYNPGWIGIDARYLACLSGTRYGYQGFAAGVLGGGLGPNIGSTPGGSWNFNGAGLRFPARNNNDLCDFDSVTVEGAADGFWMGDHVSIRKLTTIDTYNGIVVDTAAGSGSGHIHGSWIGEYSCEAAAGSQILVNGTGETNYPLVIGLLDGESNGHTVTDTGILSGAINWYDINTATPSVSGTTNLKITNCRLGPGLWGSPPAVPATTTAVASTSMPWRDAMVNIQPAGATITAITVGGTALTGVTSGPVLVPSGSTIALTYTGGTPTWQWWLS